MRFEVKDKKGVLSNVTKTFSINKVSIKRLIQNPYKNKKNSSILIITHKARNSDLVKTIKQLSNKKYITKKPKFANWRFVMSLNSKLLDQFISVTEKAAYGASFYIGKNDKILADKGAVDNMRSEINKIDIDGTIVIGEGEMDEAPMLYVGEKVGTKKGPSVDIAVDPLEGTKFVAKGLPNSFSMLAISNSGCMFSAPDTYMEKIAIGNDLPKNLLDLDNSVEKNIDLLAKAKNKRPDQIVACVLDRPRHKKIISSLKNLNVKIKFITDGDVSAALAVVDKKSPIDIYLGIGGGPEGVLAAAGLSCLGGQMQTRLFLDEETEIKAENHGIKDIKKKYNIDELIKGDVMFVATAITDGDITPGIQNKAKSFIASTYALHKDSKTEKKVSNHHNK